MSANIDILRNLLNELSIINRDVKSISIEIYNFPYKMLNNKEIGNKIRKINYIIYISYYLYNIFIFKLFVIVCYFKISISNLIPNLNFKINIYYNILNIYNSNYRFIY